MPGRSFDPHATTLAALRGRLQALTAPWERLHADEHRVDRRGPAAHRHADAEAGARTARAGALLPLGERDCRPADQVPLWDRALDGEAPWDEVFAGQRSSADWPGGYFYRELMDAYPDAKVLLSVREGESWERSFRETIVEMCLRRVGDGARWRTPARRSTPRSSATWRSSTACSGDRRARSRTGTSRSS